MGGRGHLLSSLLVSLLLSSSLFSSKVEARRESVFLFSLPLSPPPTSSERRMMMVGKTPFFSHPSTPPSPSLTDAFKKEEQWMEYIKKLRNDAKVLKILKKTSELDLNTSPPMAWPLY